MHLIRSDLVVGLSGSIFSMFWSITHTPLLHYYPENNMLTTGVPCSWARPGLAFVRIQTPWSVM